MRVGGIANIDMKVQTNWNLGNFTVALSTEATDAVRDRLASYGLRFLAQRVTAVDKVMGGFETVNGKEKRKTGWKRGQVAYTPEMATALAGVFAELAFPDDPKDAVAAVASITEYVRDTVESKFTEETAIASRHESAGDLEEWLVDKVGYADDTHGEDGEYSRAMLLAVREYKRRMLAWM